MHDDSLAEPIVVDVLVPVPDEKQAFLRLERVGQVEIQPGMNEDVAVRLDVVFQPGEELPVFFGNVFPLVGIETVEGLNAAPIGEPVVEQVPVVGGFEHAFVVVAHEAAQLVAVVFQLQDGVEHAFRVGSPVNVVAEEVEFVGSGQADLVEQGMEGEVAAVDVGDGEFAHGGEGI